MKCDPESRGHWIPVFDGMTFLEVAIEMKKGILDHTPPVVARTSVKNLADN